MPQYVTNFGEHDVATFDFLPRFAFTSRQSSILLSREVARLLMYVNNVPLKMYWIVEKTNLATRTNTLLVPRAACRVSTRRYGGSVYLFYYISAPPGVACGVAVHVVKLVHTPTRSISIYTSQDVRQNMLNFLTTKT